MNKKLINFNFKRTMENSVKKTIKCCSFILLISICYSFTGIYSQNKTFNIEFNNVSLKQIILEIEKQSEFVIIYDDDVWELLNRKVKKFEVKDKNITHILNSILSADQFTYTINDRQVVISKKDKQTSLEPEAVTLQQKTIKGTIIDEAGIPVIGVNILVAGTTRGTQTDFDGNYSIRANEGEFLEFSYVGMESQRIKVGEQSTINLTLKEDAAGLDEVVVVAFGEQKN